MHLVEHGIRNLYVAFAAFAKMNPSWAAVKSVKKKIEQKTNNYHQDLECFSMLQNAMRIWIMNSKAKNEK